MIQKYITHKRNENLILFFAGWGMDTHPFLSYDPDTSDLMVCYDYRTMDFNLSTLSPYTSIDVIAWSMGVWTASQVLSGLSLPYRNTIAVNGTPFPIDEFKGIPPSIYQGTLENLDKTTLQKFFHRMCKDNATFKCFLQKMPQRPVEELKEELEMIRLNYTRVPSGNFTWQKAFIGKNDRIFPPVNQQRAWEETNTCIFENEEAHYNELLFSELLTNPPVQPSL